MKKDWFFLILKHLHDNYTPELIELNDFLIAEIGLSKTSLADIIKCHTVLSGLQNKQYIKYGYHTKGATREIKDRVSGLGEDHSKVNPERLPGNLENISISARLTIDGYNYISSQLRENRIENQISTQTFITQISALLVALTAVATIVTTVKEIWLSPPAIDKETKQLLRTQVNKVGSLEKSLQRIDSTFQIVADSLKN